MTQLNGVTSPPTRITTRDERQRHLILLEISDSGHHRGDKRDNCKLQGMPSHSFLSENKVLPKIVMLASFSKFWELFKTGLMQSMFLNCSLLVLNLKYYQLLPSCYLSLLPYLTKSLVKKSYCFQASEKES